MAGRKRETKVPTMRTGCAGESLIAGRVTRTLAIFSLVSAMGFICVTGTGPALAQDPGNSSEVPIGTFNLGATHDGFSIVEPPAGVPKPKRDGADDGSGRWFFQNWQSAPSESSSADDLYRDAMKALEGGRRDEAQRLFERLIAEAPDSPRVAAARKHLGQIYLSTQTGAQAAPAAGIDGTAALPWTSSREAAAKPAPLGVSQAVSRAEIHQARVSQVLDGQFLSDAGDRVFFSAGSADLGARARGVIQSQARFLSRYPELFAAVEGYADDGSLPEVETQRLSEQRAAVVRDRLVAEGVAPHRLLAYGRAREDRVSDCPAPECLAQNRRAVTILLNRRIQAPARSVRRAHGEPESTTTLPVQ